MTKQREMNTTKGKLMRPLPRECGHSNTDKSHVLRVTRKQNPIILWLYPACKVLETVDSVPPGSHSNLDLRWSRHVENIPYKAYQSLGFLRWNLSNLKSVVYKTLVRPLLEYSSVASASFPVVLGDSDVTWPVKLVRTARTGLGTRLQQHGIPMPKRMSRN